MNRKWLSNLFTVAPLTLYSCILQMILKIKHIVFPEYQIIIYFAIVLMYTIFVFYYVLLKQYLQKETEGSVKYKKYCDIIMIIGTIFALFSLAF